MRIALLLVSLALPLAAQLPFVSPAQATTVEGSSNNIFPFQSPIIRTYQQIHADLPLSTPLSIARLSFRINATSTPITYAGTRVIDTEMSMGNGPASHTDVSRTFAANFTGAPTAVVARRILNWGPYGTTLGPPGPEPFTSNQDYPLDAPYVWAPVITPTLTWEVKIFSNSGAGTNPLMDADASSVTTVSAALTGVGCTCTGATAAHLLAVSAADVQGYFALAVGVTNGPPSTPVLLALGLNNLNVGLPGLCSNILTDLQLLLPLGTTSATGAIANSNSEVGLHVPNTLGGATFYLQAHAVDVGFGIPICNSEGRSVTAPLRNTTKVLRVSRMFDSSGTTAATTGVYFTASAMGYGVVTQFN